jgi:bifunctional DNA-binding transcriptional regulator/antitoxin component of YhaV-PrlF toxin-antitoxin module
MAAQTEITVVTDRGQISIPAQLRRELAMVKGQRLLWERVGERELRLTILKPPTPRGAQAMRGFARRFRKSPRATAEWMAELRQGEDEWPGSSTPAS